MCDFYDSKEVKTSTNAIWVVQITRKVRAAIFSQCNLGLRFTKNEKRNQNW